MSVAACFNGIDQLGRRGLTKLLLLDMTQVYSSEAVLSLYYMYISLLYLPRSSWELENQPFSALPGRILSSFRPIAPLSGFTGTGINYTTLISFFLAAASDFSLEIFETGYGYKKKLNAHIKCQIYLRNVRALVQMVAF